LIGLDHLASTQEDLMANLLRLTAAWTIFATCLIAPAMSEPAWKSKFGQGSKSYVIESDTGSSFLVYCFEGDTPTSGFYFNSPKANGTEEAPFDLVLRIDGQDDRYSATCTQGSCQFASFNFRTDAQLQDTLNSLRSAKKFSVVIPALDIDEPFSTRGSAKSIEKNALKSCKQ
jgi:hypothetical protein